MLQCLLALVTMWMLVAATPVEAQPETHKVFELLQERSLHIDEVIEASGFSASTVSQILLELELQGFLKQLPGQRYSAER